MSIDDLEYYSPEEEEKYDGPRIETGIVQIDDDWPGVFIRGDSALMGYAPALKSILEGSHEDGISMGILRGLYSILISAQAPAKDVQHIVRKSSGKSS